MDNAIIYNYTYTFLIIINGASHLTFRVSQQGKWDTKLLFQKPQEINIGEEGLATIPKNGVKLAQDKY